MFFKLSVVGNKCEDISYIISKHPESVFERDVKNRGKIVAKFEQFGDYRVVYSGYLENFSLPFYKICRQENLSSYVTSEQYSVCPYNLELLDVVFRSVLRGNFDGISEEQFYTEYKMEMMIGPYSLYNISRLKDAFRAFGYKVVSNVDEVGPYVLMIQGTNNVMTFLQQVYVISYAYTNHLRQIIPQKQDVKKYMNLSKGWIEDHPFRNYLINRISKVRRNVKSFEIGLLEEQGVDTKDAAEIVKDKMSTIKTRSSELRYQTIKTLLKPYMDTTILDFGCGNGNLINRVLKDLKPKKIIGFDSEKKLVNTAYKRGKQQLRHNRNKETEFKALAGSILYPDYSLFEGTGIVVLSEVIEHFEPHELDRVLDIIFKGINPFMVILTTPNKDFNAQLNMEENQLRHPDHKFEFTKEEVIEFVEKIQEKYGYYYSFWWPEDLENDCFNVTQEPSDNLSFIIRFELNETLGGHINNKELIKESTLLYSPFSLDVGAYRLSSRVIREGSATFNHKVNPNWIVSLAPTMSPADSNIGSPYLEDPLDAINYYVDRGVNDLILEVKYMGSRGTIVATKERKISEQLFNSSELMKIYSRKGYDFFEDKTIEDQIYEDVRSLMKVLDNNILVIDSEILPWYYKAGVMIEKEFNKPGLCALLDKEYTGRNTINEQLYLKSLSNYNGQTPIKIYPFNILLAANFDGRKFRNVSNGYHINHVQQLKNMYNFCYNSEIFDDVNYVLYTHGVTNERIVNVFWKRICDLGLEGMVVKPAYPTRFLENGRYIQPSLKCRTPDYLRIIYGIDYLNPENMEFLKKRRTASKRKLAMQQFELSQKILYSFINRDDNQRLKYIFGFFGMEKVSVIDNTL